MVKGQSPEEFKVQGSKGNWWAVPTLHISFKKCSIRKSLSRPGWKKAATGSVE
jgi:hypothetical protein